MEKKKTMQLMQDSEARLVSGLENIEINSETKDNVEEEILED